MGVTVFTETHCAVQVTLAKRLSRRGASELESRLRRMDNVIRVVNPGTRVSFALHGKPGTSAFIMERVDAVLQEMDLLAGRVFYHYEPPEFYHSVFHLSPKPSTERLKEIVDQVGEVPGTERRLSFAPPLPTDRVDLFRGSTTACLFVHVYFDRECDDDTLAAAKQQVVAIVGVQPFDMSLLAP